MKSKIRIISLAMLIVILTLSLSSCYLLDPSMSALGGNTSINVDDVNNYDVDVTTNEDATVIGTSKALMSVVSIAAKFRKATPTIPSFGTSSNESVSWGSGVIFKMSEDKSTAYILTNYHVVFNTSVSSDINVFLYGKESYLYESGDTLGCAIKATYLGGSMAYDLAVIKVENSKILMESNAQACTFANSNDVAILETAIAIGNAKGNGISATMGRVNVDSEYISMLGPDDSTKVTLRVMRTDAAVNSGNSGGGLFNEKGELIGIVNAKLVDSTVDNIGYAIPSNVAKYIAENIIHYCDGDSSLRSVYRCMLDIGVTVNDIYTEYDTEKALLYKRETVAISSIDDNSAVKGVLKVGDVINSITIDTETYEVNRMFHVIDSMLNARVGSTVVFNITRGGTDMEATVSITQSMLKNADEIEQ